MPTTARASLRSAVWCEARQDGVAYRGVVALESPNKSHRTSVVLTFDVSRVLTFDYSPLLSSGISASSRPSMTVRTEILNDHRNGATIGPTEFSTRASSRTIASPAASPALSATKYA